MKNNNDEISGAFKYPLPTGMDENNLPLQLKQRRETIMRQARMAMDQAEDLGEGLVQALGEFLVESDFSQRRGDEIAISPEIIVVLLGLAAGHVAATDQSAEALNEDPDFARLVDQTYRQNLLEMFQVGHAATSRKMRLHEPSFQETEEKVIKRNGGKLIQFPSSRVNPKKSDD